MTAGLALPAVLAALAGLVLLRRPLAALLRLGVRWVGGLAALALLQPLGLSLGVNPVNALVLGVLGAPGFGLLLLLQWTLHTP